MEVMNYGGLTTTNFAVMYYTMKPVISQPFIILEQHSNMLPHHGIFFGP